MTDQNLDTSDMDLLDESKLHFSAYDACMFTNHFINKLLKSVIHTCTPELVTFQKYVDVHVFLYIYVYVYGLVSALT